MNPSAAPEVQPEALLASIVDGSNDAIVSKRLDGTITSWNKGAEHIFGYRADEIIGRSIRVLIPADRQAEEDAIITRVVAGERVGSLHTERLRKDGTLVRLSITVSPIRDADGRIVGASKIGRDIGAIEDTRRDLAESERRFHMLADNMAQLAWIAQADGGIFWYNRRWFEYTGTTLDEMRGWGWQAVHHPDHVDRVTNHFRACIEAGDTWEDSFPLRGADGKYCWFLSRAEPIRGDDGEIEYWFGTNTDITRQREQALSIETLLSEVNHRSKNMLTVIMALARRSAPGNEEFLKRFVRRIEALAVNQDLLVGRDWHSIALRDLVAAQLAFAVDLVGPKLSFDGPDLEIGARAAEVIGMALHELATNALKHGALSSDGGAVEIAWTAANRTFDLRWTERGGPVVRPPERHGFGTSVIRDIPRSSVDATVELDYAPEGLRWSLTAPVEVVQSA